MTIQLKKKDENKLDNWHYTETQSNSSATLSFFCGFFLAFSILTSTLIAYYTFCPHSKLNMLKVPQLRLDDDQLIIPSGPAPLEDF